MADPPSPSSGSEAADKPSLAAFGHLANAAGIVGDFRRVPVTATWGDTWPAAKHLFSVGMMPSRPHIAH